MPDDWAGWVFFLIDLVRHPVLTLRVVRSGPDATLLDLKRARKRHSGR